MADSYVRAWLPRPRGYSYAMVEGMEAFGLAHCAPLALPPLTRLVPLVALVSSRPNTAVTPRAAHSAHRE